MINRLPELITASLTALSADATDLGLVVEHGAEGALLRMGAMRFSFGGDPFDDILVWERLADALPRAVEKARLAAMHALVGATSPAPWSVFTTATTLAWLTWASGGRDTPRWRSHLDPILSAADLDGDVRIAQGGMGAGALDGIMRSRGLFGTISLAPGIDYIASLNALFARETLPHTTAGLIQDHDVNAIVRATWLEGSGVTVAEMQVDELGTLLLLTERLFPLEEIPAKAFAAARPGGPAHAPWQVTRQERDELDEIDEAAHRKP